jgi:outer membrane protein
LDKIVRFTFFSLVLAMIAMADANAQDYKLGAVNAIRILEASPQAEAARNKIEKEFAPRDKQLVEQQKQLKALEDKLLKDGPIMSEAERTKLEQEIVNKRRDLRRSQEEFREDLNIRRNEEFAKIQKTILEAIQKVAKDSGYDVVLGEGVIYASPKVDISDKVIEYLKSQHSAGGGQ